MNGPNHSNPFYPPPTTTEETNTNPFHQQQNPPPSSSLYPQVNTESTPHETDTNPFAANPAPPPVSDHAAVTVHQAPLATPPPVNFAPSSSSSQQAPACDKEEGPEKWGTNVMGAPAVPTVHPDNQKAAFWGANSADGSQAQYHHHPYLQYEPVERSSSSSSPMENILNTFNSWSNKAENLANNIWHNLKTGPSVKEAAWGKVNLRAKTITGGGFETLYKQSFTTFPNEALKKTFACYLSTSTGPVAGTLYLSNLHAAFCSDRPLSFTAPSGQISWSYYKVMMPLGKICAVNPVVMRENQSERYIQIVTGDGPDFWFMGFVNYEKASRHLTESISGFITQGVAVNPPPPAP
ncbi:hypothetical protein MLD38_000282 [Melastoma candidum]|uniref:Uncharacterized protein n=1 Tax=Melastoma candidum TaxID=119954 RepID=A0ACB9SI64_9MYRT|nr:hypothetical protein MLD38_000282 [Melastoma candidum]